MKNFMKSLLVIIFSVLIICQPAFSQEAVSQKANDIVIIYTNDVHCAVDKNIGYAGLVHYRDEMKKTHKYVTLVDAGDMLQGDVICTMSHGRAIFDIVNEVGYDFCTLGNHEFDYGMENLAALMDTAASRYVLCNCTYSGSGKNPIAKMRSYAIKKFGGKRVAFIGVLTPATGISSPPSNFTENGRRIFSFTKNLPETEENLAAIVQKNVDAARAHGADYIVLLSHLGDGAHLFSSVNLAQATYGIDVIIDGHEHHVIEKMSVPNKDGKNVIITSTGTAFANIGCLTIGEDGSMSTELVKSAGGNDEKISALIRDIRAQTDKKGGTIVGHSNFAMSMTDEENIRITRTRETGIGNLCADSWRWACSADVTLLNAGDVRSGLLSGNITLKDILNVLPFDCRLVSVRATGQDILDALEAGSFLVENVYKKDGKSVGENGGFMLVSGLKYTVDTSVPTPAVLSAGKLEIGDSARRVKDVFVFNKDNKEYEPLIPDKEYIVCGNEFIILSGGDGIAAFKKYKPIEQTAVMDFEALRLYIEKKLNGEIPLRYSQPEGRITIR